MTSLIDRYMDFCNVMTDAPDMYNKLSAIHLIGCAMKRKYVIDISPFKRRPNTYVFIVGKSRSRKSTSRKILVEFLEMLRLQTCASNTTPQALLEELIDKPVSSLVKDEVGSMLKSMRSAEYFSEWIEIQCDLWDKYDVFIKRTRSHGEEIINNPFFNEWLATTETRFNTYMQNEFITTGWLPRYLLFIMKEKDRKPTQPLASEEEKRKQAKPHFDFVVKRLKKVVHTRHEITFKYQKAELALINKYIISFNNVRNANTLLDAFYGTAGEHVIKLSCIFKMANLGEKKLKDIDVPNSIVYIEQRYINKAYRLVKFLLQRYKEAFGTYIEWENKPGTVKNTLIHIQNQQDLFLSGKSDYINTQIKDLYGATNSDKETMERVLMNLFVRDLVMKVRVYFKKDKKKYPKTIFILRNFFKDIKEYSNLVEIKGISYKYDGDFTDKQKKEKKLKPDDDSVLTVEQLGLENFNDYDLNENDDENENDES